MKTLVAFVVNVAAVGVGYWFWLNEYIFGSYVIATIAAIAFGSISRWWTKSEQLFAHSALFGMIALLTLGELNYGQHDVAGSTDLSRIIPKMIYEMWDQNLHAFIAMLSGRGLAWLTTTGRHLWQAKARASSG